MKAVSAQERLEGQRGVRRGAFFVSVPRRPGLPQLEGASHVPREPNKHTLVHTVPYVLGPDAQTAFPDELEARGHACPACLMGPGLR